MAVKIFLPFEDFKVHIVHNDFSSLIEKKIIFSTYTFINQLEKIWGTKIALKNRDYHRKKKNR